MARTAAVSTLSPLVFSPGSAIQAEDVLAVAQQLNWSGARRVTTHACLNTGDNTDVIIIGTNKCVVTATVGVFRVRVRHTSRISRDALQVQVRYRVNVASAGTTIRSRVTVGGATAVTTSHTSAGNSTDTTVTLNTSSTGTGFVSWTLELERQSGAARSYLGYYIAEDLAIVTLPAPQE